MGRHRRRLSWISAQPHQDATTMRTGYLLASSAVAALMLTALTPASSTRKTATQSLLPRSHPPRRAHECARGQMARPLHAARWRYRRLATTSASRFSRFVAATPASMGDDWEDRKEREWNATQCRDPRSRRGDRKRLDRSARSTRQQRAGTSLSTPSATRAFSRRVRLSWSGLPALGLVQDVPTSSFATFALVERWILATSRG